MSDNKRISMTLLTSVACQCKTEGQIERQNGNITMTIGDYQP